MRLPFLPIVVAEVKISGKVQTKSHHTYRVGHASLVPRLSMGNNREREPGYEARDMHAHAMAGHVLQL